MTVELFKVVVQPVAVERDEDGAIIGERIGEATAFYTVAQIQEYVETLRAQWQNGNGKR